MYAKSRKIRIEEKLAGAGKLVGMGEKIPHI
jgi:hypothetical protein